MMASGSTPDKPNDDEDIKPDAVVGPPDTERERIRKETERNIEKGEEILKKLKPGPKQPLGDLPEGASEEEKRGWEKLKRLGPVEDPVEDPDKDKTTLRKSGNKGIGGDGQRSL